MSSFKPSQYQEAIKEFAVKGSGNAIINAVAGSGKTTTLVNFVYPALQGQIGFFAFNKSIANELSERMPDATCMTIHSLGYGAIRELMRTKVDTSKYRTIARNVIGSDAPFNVVADIEKGISIERPILKLIDLARSTLTDPTCCESMIGLIDHYEVEVESDLDFTLYVVRKSLSLGKMYAREGIDFSDMLWLPATEDKYQPQKFDFLLVDECQDLSAAQLAVIKKAFKPGGRAIFVGDDRQAINGFAGADNRSFQKIKEDLNCQEFPLSICYRCPTSHIELAQKIVPVIEASASAIKGTVSQVNREDLTSTSQTGDMVLCRTNAPLVSLCLELIGSGKPARIKGRDIGKGLISLAKKISKTKGFPGWKEFRQAVIAWQGKECDKLRKKGAEDDDPRFQNIEDRVNCLIVIWSENQINSLADFQATVNNIFSDDTPGIQLSSVHRAKGLEADRVFILEPERMPLPFVREGSWQYEQEMNLKYVALTRSKKDLFFVG